jgi:hypothetical protein
MHRRFIVTNGAQSGISIANHPLPAKLNERGAPRDYCEVEQMYTDKSFFSFLLPAADLAINGGRICPRRFLPFLWVGLAGSMLLGGGANAQEMMDCARPAPQVPAVTISHRMLTDVCIPAGFSGNPIAYFDDFSWRSFLSLVWPAKQGQRGKPDSSLPIGAVGKPTVFETYKAEWEVFQPDGKAPVAWNVYGGENPCKVADIAYGDLVLAAFSKFANLGMAGFGPKLTGALVAQNNTYVRYAVGFNEVEFAEIRAKNAYLRANLATNISFKVGAVDIKAAWIDMKGIPNPDRYHTRQAWLLDLATNTCAKTLVGLVGLHIVTKTPSRPQWIWTTFEHVGNVPEARGARGGFAFNSGNGVPMPGDNPVKFPIPTKAPAPYNVERLKPIDPSTVATNAAYQQALRAAGSVWQNYQLVMTQWPRDPFNVPSQPGTPDHTFPGDAPFDASAFSNTTMETFEQKDITTGCMNCHNIVRSKTDYLWTVMTRAHPSILRIMESLPAPVFSMNDKSLGKSKRAAGVAVPPPDQMQAFEALKNLLEKSSKK